jgi:dethiobiotin synthetase
MNRGYFVTGTGTDVGKTVVSAWLCYHLGAAYWKPMQSGNLDQPEEATVAKLANLSPQAVYPQVYSMTQPLSPHLAAKLDGIEIDITKLQLPKSEQLIVVEGAGGTLVPLNNMQLMTDLMVELDLPTIVVASSGLGTINHTCMTLEVLKNRGIDVRGVIMVGLENAENKYAIEHYGHTQVIAEIPWLDSLTHQTLTEIPMSDNCREILKA